MIVRLLERARAGQSIWPSATRAAFCSSVSFGSAQMSTANKLYTSCTVLSGRRWHLPEASVGVQAASFRTYDSVRFVYQTIFEGRISPRGWRCKTPVF